MSDLSPKPLVKTDVKTQSAALTTAPSDAAVLSVEQLNQQIKQVIEGQIGTVWVQGELSNFKAHSSGHFYFSLKDSKAQISAVMFRGSNSRLRFKPADGLEVIVRGRVTVYEPRGNYQIVCDSMEPVGAGALQKAFEQLRDKLKSEGLFAPERKRAIPSFPRHVAVVTSPTGAAIRDILNIMSRRAKSVRVTVVPTVVQGESAAPQIVEALKKAYLLPDVDVIIVGRGGGSMEDMWCFNDETLARTVVLSPVPIISAVGHEIDFTISDFVADLRAPTPSAAAELVAKSSTELGARISQLERLLRVSLDRKLKTLAQALGGLHRQLVDPRKKLQDLALRNDDLFTRLELAMRNLIKDRRHRVQMVRQCVGSPEEKIRERRQKLQLKTVSLGKSLELLLEKRKARTQRLMSLLDSLSPLKVVERGYSIVSKGGEVVKSSSQVKVGDEIRIRLADGGMVAQVTATERKEDGL
ncbi:MAG: exodeoxyribonuclease VII large subunit [Bdellovibrionaceae bacterium]|nr:exodeoxyribonuclease VII large subunit [Pseudobdellovibrionaceae bacterium]MBX3034080.1 exodeoxyribonuclease VII large subunit [Pseudobdellovibrionaceae bacterium]